MGLVETQETFPGAMSQRNPTDEEKLARNVWGGESSGVGCGDQEAGASVGTVCVWGGRRLVSPASQGSRAVAWWDKWRLDGGPSHSVSWVLLEGLGSHSGI